MVTFMIKRRELKINDVTLYKHWMGHLGKEPEMKKKNHAHKIFSIYIQNHFSKFHLACRIFFKATITSLINVSPKVL